MTRRKIQIEAILVALGSFAGWGTWSVLAREIAASSVAETDAGQPRKSLVGQVIINHPVAPPAVDLGVLDDEGTRLTAPCSTCHSTREPNRALARAEDLDEFHQGLIYIHGGLSCFSCHFENNYVSLRLANGQTIEFSDVLMLCSQCHGPQRRDFDHGAHGGMAGYWDLTRGGRVRNNCVDCHDPHAPAFPQMRPTFKPRDRFLESHTHTESESHE